MHQKRAPLSSLLFSPTRGEEARGQQDETNRASNLTSVPIVLRLALPEGP